MTRKSSLTPEEAAIVGKAIVELSDPERWIKGCLFSNERDACIPMSMVAQEKKVPTHACAVGHLLLAMGEAAYFDMKREELPAIIKSIDTKYWMKFGEHISSTNDAVTSTNKTMANALCQLLLSDEPWE